MSVCQTADGGYVLAGGTDSFGAGNGDIWLVKTDAGGQLAWNQTFGGAAWDNAWSVRQTADGGYVLAGVTTSYGAGNGDFWLMKTDASGQVTWNQTFGEKSWIVLLQYFKRRMAGTFSQDLQILMVRVNRTCG